MASRSESIIDAVKAALATINGTGAYHHDLSATGQVIEGDPPDQSGIVNSKCAYVGFSGPTSRHDEVMGRYRRDLVVEITAFVPATDDTPKQRARAALRMADDICTAIEADRSLGSLVHDVIIETAVVTGTGWGGPTMAVVIANVNVYWSANSAAGV